MKIIREWADTLTRIGLKLTRTHPIHPKHNSGIFLLMDNLWHVKQEVDCEIGEAIFPFLSANPKFPAAFRKIFTGLLEMGTDWQDCSGAVYLVRKLR